MPNNIFDNAKKVMYDTALSVMGRRCAWVSSLTTQSYSALVHFKYPTQKEELAGIDFMPVNPFMEYRESEFPGLKSAVDAGEMESVNIEGHGVFVVRSVERRFDGDILKAYLES
jgi:hypothetical protein